MAPAAIFPLKMFECLYSNRRRSNWFPLAGIKPEILRNSSRTFVQRGRNLSPNGNPEIPRAFRRSKLTAISNPAAPESRCFKSAAINHSVPIFLRRRVASIANARRAFLYSARKPPGEFNHDARWSKTSLRNGCPSTDGFKKLINQIRGVKLTADLPPISRIPRGKPRGCVRARETRVTVHSL